VAEIKIHKLSAVNTADVEQCLQPIVVRQQSSESLCISLQLTAHLVTNIIIIIIIIIII
jgi:hypothetical protein